MKNRFTKVLLILIGALIILPACIGQAAGNKPIIRISIIQDGPWARFPKALDSIKLEVTALVEAEFDVRFPRELTVHGQWTVAGINAALDRQLASPEVDLIITMGYVVSHEAVKRRDLAKPVIAALLVDVDMENLPTVEGGSGIRNLSYIDRQHRLDRAIYSFQDIVPIQHLTLLADSFIVESLPRVFEIAKKPAAEKSMRVTVIRVEDGAASVLDRIPEDSDGVFVTPLFRMDNREFQGLIDGLIARKIPSYSYIGVHEVEQGILATFTPRDNFVHLSRSIAMLVHDILRGEKPENVQVNFVAGHQPTINMATARAINVHPNFYILTEADLLNDEETGVGRVLTLEKAVQESLVANRDLVAADYAVLAGAKQVNERRAVLLPQIGLSGGAVAIDEDRATISQGTEPERRLTGSIRGAQLIYSETAWRNYSVEKELQNSRVSGREALRLDTILAASTAYLNVLRTKSVEKIQKDNLKLTRANLERARVRVDIGAAGPEEVYRWENEIALQRQAVLRDESDTLDRMNDLNRILNRPLRESFQLGEKELTDPLVMLGDTRLLPYVKNRRNLNILRDFIVQKGLEISPELQSIDAEIVALERIETAAKRDFWLPDFTLEGDITEIFQKCGAGSTSPAGLNDTDWTVGVFATFPLFTGGGKTATLGRSREQLTSLRTERQATVERIEQRMLSAINLIRASYPSIQLSRDAAIASDKNLTLVTDSYERGILSIIDLLDAQNQALSSNRQASNAVYDFLIDLMSVQRALGVFVFFLEEGEKQKWFKEIQEFYQAAESADQPESVAGLLTGPLSGIR